MIRIQEINGEKYYCCSDLTKCFQQKNAHALFEKQYKKTIKQKTTMGMQSMSFVNEQYLRIIIGKLKHPIEYKSKLMQMIFNDSHVPFYSYREEEFYGILEKILKNTEFFDIYKQYSVGRYRVDFYIPTLGLIIEFDEEHHNSKAEKENDLKREKEIIKILSEDQKIIRGDGILKILRIQHNKVFEGINAIILEILHAANPKDFPITKIKEIA